MDQFKGSVERHLKSEFMYEIHVDASLQGLYAIPILYTLKDICNIVHVEVLNILVVLKCWIKCLANKKVIVWCDNKAVVNAFRNFLIRDPILMACVCNIWLLAAVFNVE